MSDRDHPYQIACTTNVVGPVGAVIGWAENPIHPSCTYRHSWVTLEDYIIEAAPGGVRINKLDAWTGRGRTVYSDFPLTTGQQEALDTFAHSKLGMRYDYLGDVIVGLDGLWLDAWKRCAAMLDHGHLTESFDLFGIAEHLEDRAHWAIFCSAFADWAMTWALQSPMRTPGQPERVMPDDRPFHAVNPNELGLRLIELFPEVNAA